MRSFFPNLVRRCFGNLFIVAVLAAGAGVLSAQNSVPRQTAQSDAHGLQPILSYISTAWDTLTRSMTDCESVVDPKMKVAPVLYLPNGMQEPEAVEQLARQCNVQVKYLPIAIHQLGEIDASQIHPDGLLYLPNKYVEQPAMLPR